MTGFLGALPHELVSLALSSDDGGRTRQLFGIASTAKVVQSAVIGALADECNWDPGSLSRLDATVSLDDETRRTAAAALPRGFYDLALSLRSPECFSCQAHTPFFDATSGRRLCEECLDEVDAEAPHTVINELLFRFDMIELDLVCGTPPGFEHGIAALQHALVNAADGSTIRLLGTASSPWEMTTGGLEQQEEVNSSPASCLRISRNIRIVGAPPAEVYYCSHHRATYPPTMEVQMATSEENAVGMVGFPTSTIHLPGNGIECDCHALQFENLYLATGDKRIGNSGNNLYGHAGSPGGGGYNTMRNFAALWLNGDKRTHLLLRNCWVTAYNGSGIMLEDGCSATLDRCCVTNCNGAGVMIKGDASLSLHESHVICNSGGISSMDRHMSAEAQARVLKKNTVHMNFHNVWRKVENFENWQQQGGIPMTLQPQAST